MNKIGVGTWKCSDRERELVNEVLNSGRLSYGPKCRDFEAEFADVHQCKFGVLSNSGTSSLQVAIQALKEIEGWKDGDEVIVPAITFVATVNAVLHNRLTPVLVDVDSVTYNMDMDAALDARTDRTRAVIPVHLFGQPADVSTLKYWSNKKIKIIEDACEASFAMHMGRRVGMWGDVGCFSMYVAHLLTTGVGGIATTNDPVLAAKMRSIVNHGRDGIYIDIDTASSREVIQKRFSFDTIGHSFRITEMEAALGVAQLETWERMVQARRENAEYLSDKLNDLREDIQLPWTSPKNTHSWMMFPIVVNYEPKWDLVNHLESSGVETREMMPLLNQPCYEGMWDADDYPVAQWIDESGFYVGIHQDLTFNDLDRIAEAIRSYF